MAPLFIDEAGLVRYGTEMPVTDPEDKTYWSVRTVEGSENGLIPKSMRAPKDEVRIRTAANLLMDWLLETYGAQYSIKPRSDGNNLPDVL